MAEDRFAIAVQIYKFYLGRFVKIMSAMKFTSVAQILKDHKTDLNQRGVKSLAIFGSIARGDENEKSDIDILVEFNKPIGLFEFIRLKYFLEDLTKQRVDLVTPDALHPALRETILDEVIYVT
jgi:uncharacterized protein